MWNLGKSFLMAAGGKIAKTAFKGAVSAALPTIIGVAAVAVAGVGVAGYAATRAIRNAGKTQPPASAQPETVAPEKPAAKAPRRRRKPGNSPEA